MLLFFFFNDTATTEIYTLSLHDALPICSARLSARSRRTLWRAARSLSAGLASRAAPCLSVGPGEDGSLAGPARDEDRKSTRLNSSHANISYAVFCLKKKKTINT